MTNPSFSLPFLSQDKWWKLDANNVPIKCSKDSIKQGYTWRQWLVHFVGKGPCGYMSIVTAVEDLYLENITRSLSQDTRTYVKNSGKESYLKLTASQKKVIFKELNQIEANNKKIIKDYSRIQHEFYSISPNLIQRCHLCFVTIVWLITSLLPEKVGLYKRKEPAFYPDDCIYALARFQTTASRLL